MENRQRLFIYDRREMIVLIFLGVMVALFAFTLGVHLGKRVAGDGETVAAHAPQGAAPGADHGKPTAPVETTADPIPNRQELTEQAKGTSQAGDEALNQSLHEEVARTGIKLDTQRQVDLPDQPKDVHGGATTIDPAPSRPAEDAAHSAPAVKEKPPVGKFALQVGSHPDAVEARKQLKALEATGLQPYMQSVQLKNKGRWFRVYIGHYATKEDAEQAGARYRAEKVIRSFIVAQPES